MLMAHTEVSLWENELSLVRDKSHLVVLSVALDELGDCGGVGSSY